MNKIYESGIKAVCVEARPHPDFLGDKWWEDLDLIMDEARRLGMKVWVLDDSHFPTGYAAGRIKKEFPHLQKQYLKLQQQDFVGPKKNTRFLVKWAKVPNPKEHVISVGVEEKEHPQHTSSQEPQDQIIGVIAAKRVGLNEIDSNTLIDISEYEENGVVYWDLPDGDWRIFTLVKTIHGGEEATKGYLNPIVPQATDILINTVYQAHYERYCDDFGKTFSGFFSDEPRFGNVKGPFATLGKVEMVLPWRDDMLTILKDKDARINRRLLPLLWNDSGEVSQHVRFKYMDIVSELFGENFTGRIGNWCRTHGVEYIGHVIEDNNAHGRLGYGAGHFFRSLWEQDMAGLDVVLHQIIPGMDKGYFKSFTSTGWDGEFFHYGLAKLGASLGHLDPKKQGRIMCEMYGAYGWGEGLKLMKWLTDHMLVRGVNYFVPHAFSPKSFPDQDCPPHFYAGGKDPQFRYMNILANYMNRMSHLLNGGTHIAQAAVLYHAEAEWSGDSMLFQKVGKELLQHQIDYDVVPADLIVKSSVLEKQQLNINNELFPALVIPYAEALPKNLIQQVIRYAKQGLPVFFIDEWPSRSSEGSNILRELNELQELCQLVPLTELSLEFKKQQLAEILIDQFVPYLRNYHYHHQDGEVYMFFNESPTEFISAEINLQNAENLYVYDGFENKLRELVREENLSFNLELSPYESIVILSGSALVTEKTLNYQNATKNIAHIAIAGEWDVSFATSEEYPSFSNSISLSNLIDLSKPEFFPDFSGTIQYKTKFNINTTDFVNTTLVLEEASEVADVWLNGVHLGAKICPPYRYSFKDILKQGTNHLTIQVTNTLVNQEKDYLSQFLPLEPTGVIGDVWLEISK